MEDMKLYAMPDPEEPETPEVDPENDTDGDGAPIEEPVPGDTEGGDRSVL